jgi:hypothetical protein
LVSLQSPVFTEDLDKSWFFADLGFRRQKFYDSDSILQPAAISLFFPFYAFLAENRQPPEASAP